MQINAPSAKRLHGLPRELASGLATTRDDVGGVKHGAPRLRRPDVDAHDRLGAGPSAAVGLPRQGAPIVGSD